MQIHLHYGDDGVTATLHADNPQAAQTLQQAAPDLRRALQAQGMTLLGLDVRDGTSQEPGERSGESRKDGGRRSGGRRGASTGDGLDGVEGVSLDPRRLPAPGSSVDVLA